MKLEKLKDASFFKKETDNISTIFKRVLPGIVLGVNESGILGNADVMSLDSGSFFNFGSSTDKWLVKYTLEAFYDKEKNFS